MMLPHIAILLACAIGLAHGHGAMTFPPPRNAIDSNEKPWGGPVPINYLWGERKYLPWWVQSL